MSYSVEDRHIDLKPLRSLKVAGNHLLGNGDLVIIELDGSESSAENEIQAEYIDNLMQQMELYVADISMKTQAAVIAVSPTTRSYSFFAGSGQQLEDSSNDLIVRAVKQACNRADSTGESLASALQDVISGGSCRS